MTCLKTVQEQLLKLSVGENCRLHELIVLEASDEYYRKWHREHWPSRGGIIEQTTDPVSFSDWLMNNGIAMLELPASDYVLFEKMK